jgi:preprotein translocase subunit SecE
MADVKAPAAKAGASAGSSPRGASLVDKLREYFISLQYEWRKITWPERKQWKDSTIVVFIFVMVLMAALSLLDLGVGWVMNRLMGLSGK